MTILVCNVRGLNKSVRRRNVKSHIQKLSRSIVALLETKVKEQHSKRLLSYIPHNWAFCNNYTNNHGGRIWVCWNQVVWTCVVIAKSSQHITLSVKNKGGFSGVISFIYGENWQFRRKVLWGELSSLAHTYNLPPWMLVGDFNVAKYSDEKVGGRTLSIQQLQDFNDFTAACALTDISHTGGKWSSHNNVTGARRLVGRLDRALCNTAWISVLPGSYYEYLSHSSSDHSPIFMHMLEKQETGKKPFKF